ncbi:MAG: PH domain-containing protein [Candidatus Micrarchaeota archaeon]
MARSFHPYPIVGVTKSAIIAVLLSALVFVLRDLLKDLMLPLLGAVIGLSLLMIIFAFIAARFHTLTISDTSISYHTGVISTRNIVLPYAKITEASYTQGLIQRLFGVGTLNLDTAGGSAVAIHITDIKRSDIEDVLTEVRTKGGKDSGGV